MNSFGHADPTPLLGRLEDTSFGWEANISLHNSLNNCTVVPYYPYIEAIYNLFGRVQSINHQFSVFFSPMTPLVEGESRPTH